MTFGVTRSGYSSAGSELRNYVELFADILSYHTFPIPHFSNTFFCTMATREFLKALYST